MQNNSSVNQITEKMKQQMSALSLKKTELQRKQKELQELQRKETNEESVIAALQLEIQRIEKEIASEHNDLARAMDASKKEIAKHGITLN